MAVLKAPPLANVPAGLQRSIMCLRAERKNLDCGSLPLRPHPSVEDLASVDHGYRRSMTDLGHGRYQIATCEAKSSAQCFCAAFEADSEEVFVRDRRRHNLQSLVRRFHLPFTPQAGGFLHALD